MPPAGFEPTIPKSEGRQTHALDRAASGIGFLNTYRHSDNQSAQVLLLSLCSHCVPCIVKRNQGKFRMSISTFNIMITVVGEWILLRKANWPIAIDYMLITNLMH